MKKRIGSKLYDTETSELIAQTVMGDVYRKRTREREWFLVTLCDYIEPLDEAEARALIGESSYRERPPESKRIMIGVDRETHEKIASAAKRQGVSIADVVRQLAGHL